MSLLKAYDNPVAVAVINGERKFYTDARQAVADAAALGGHVMPANETPGKVANGYIVAPGDKVIILQHGPRGSRWQIKATVVKVNRRTVTVDMRFVGKDSAGRKTGTVRLERKAIDNRHIWRSDWE